jgi:hypothetical protein
MLDLKDKSAPREKVPGRTALTPTEWRNLLANKPGMYSVVGGRPETSEHVTRPLSRCDAQYVFESVVDECDFRAKPGYRVRIVAVT